jgi:hypothetical protein
LSHAVANAGFDARAVAQFVFDDAEDAALLTGDEDAARIGRVVAAVALGDVGALDTTGGEPLVGIDDNASGTRRVRYQRLRPHHNVKV